MTTNQIKQLGNTVGFVVGINRPAVISLLRANDVNVTAKTDVKSVMEVCINRIINDPSFNKAFDALAKKTARDYIKVSKSEKNYSNFVMPTIDIPQTNVQPQTQSSFDWGGLASGVLSSGLGIFSQIQSTKAQEKLANQQAKVAELEAQSALNTAQAQIEIEKLRLQQLQAQKAGGTGNTLVYVGIGLVGLLVVGGIILAVKK